MLVIRILFALFVAGFISYALSRRPRAIGGIGLPGNFLSWTVNPNLRKVFILTLLWSTVLFGPLLFGERETMEWSLRNFWWDKVTYKVGLALILAFTLYGYSTKGDPNNPFQWTLAKWLMRIAIVITILYLSWEFLPGVGKATANGVGMAMDGIVSTTGSARGVNPPRIGRAETERIVNEFWYRNIPRDKAKIMIDVVVRGESQFRQWNDQGTVLTNVNADGSLDLGVHQLNTVQSAKEITECGCDITTLEGNLKAALLVYNNGGLERWVTYRNYTATKESIVTHEAPVGNFGRKYAVLPNCDWRVDKHVIVQDDFGNKYTLKPDAEYTMEDPVPIFISREQSYMTETEPPAKVEYICRR